FTSATYSVSALNCCGRSGGPFPPKFLICSELRVHHATPLNSSNVYVYVRPLRNVLQLWLVFNEIQMRRGARLSKDLPGRQASLQRRSGFDNATLGLSRMYLRYDIEPRRCTISSC